MTQLDTTEYPDPGLYLLYPDGSRLDLTRDHIEALTREILDDPSRIPPHLKAATEYEACAICPERYRAEICHSIMTTLPFMDEIDRHMSYDRVTAVFRSPEDNILHVVETTMQEALKYVTILALVHYCEVGRGYDMYFKGVDPLMPPQEIAAHVYRNIFFDMDGDLRATEAVILKMHEDIQLTTSCQVKRLQLISTRDAFANAFIATFAVIEMLFLELQRRVESR